MNQRKQRLENQIGAFVQQYGRKKGTGGRDPNDRSYDRKIESLVARMDPEELDEILHGEADPTETADAVVVSEDPDPL